MSNPVTPSRRGEEINNIVFALNTKWNLNLPLRSAPQSPSKVLSPESPEEQIFHTIKLLFFQDIEALHYACKRFEDHARQYPSEWVYKPNGETDTLPSRPSANSYLKGNSWLKTRSTVNESAVQMLQETLLRFLTEAKRNWLLKRSAPKVTVIDELPLRGRSEKSASIGLSLPTPTTAPQSLKSAANNSVPTSSAAFNPDSDTVDAMEDLVAEFRYPAIVGPRLTAPFQSDDDMVYDSLEDPDVFTTPPTSPTKQSLASSYPLLPSSLSNSNDDVTDAYFVQSPDPIILSSPSNSTGKKRSAPEPLGVPVSRKINYDLRSRASPQVYNVHHLEPTYELTRTFDSVSTAMSSRAASTTHTTPNTSFYTESSATSFGRSTSDLASDQLMREQAEYNRTTLSDIHLSTEDMEVGIETLRKSDRYPTGSSSRVSAKPIRAGNSLDAVRRHTESLIEKNPFVKLKNHIHPQLDYRHLYEASRVALYYDVPISTLPTCSSNAADGYDDFWSAITSMNTGVVVMPEKSNLEAWSRAEKDPEDVVFAGDLKFSNDIRAPMFQLQLKPLKTDRSYRLARKFGGDRFFILGIPGLTERELPSYLRSGAGSVRSAIISWLLETEHHFLDRTWRAFFVKPQQTSTKVRKAKISSFNSIRHRIYLFAVDGRGFKRRSRLTRSSSATEGGHVAMTVQELLEWIIPFEQNADQSCLKLFARISLALTNTVSTVEFKPREILRTVDAYSGWPDTRRLPRDRHDIGRTFVGSVLSSNVMNDGCARISRAAALAIAGKLGLHGQTPCVYQGRIGGAKGIWMIDTLDETVSSSDRDFWIEVTDSQLKFVGHSCDLSEIGSDTARLTFEVHAYSTPLTPAALNYQLMPILLEQGVKGKVFERLLEKDLTEKVTDLENAMDSGLLLRMWNQENSSTSLERMRSPTLEFQGGLPESAPETINWLLEHGFEPKSCRLLRDFCYRAISKYCERLKDRMNIGIGRSTYAFMIADPLAILKEGEVHLGFSGAFRDEKTGFYDTMLNNMDVLVGRLPAHLPSDIRKVRAIFKPELSDYKDVIIFSSRGDSSLASKLSGGDYDGDHAWICWEPELVQPFTNAECHIPPDLDYYGITKDNTKVSDIISSPDYISSFLSRGFEFNIQSPILGMCTAYHESLCYRYMPISNDQAKNLAVLLGFLVDSAKGGFIFTEEIWKQFRAANGLPMNPKQPAYKSGTPPSRVEHIIDRLVFVIAKKVIDTALSQFSERFKDANDWDDDLNAVWKAEDEASARDPHLKRILVDLRVRLDELHAFWARNAHIKDPDEARPSRNDETSFRARLDQVRERFLAIQPLHDHNPHAMAVRWAHDAGSTKGAWTRLKASALFKMFHTRGKFVWYVAGHELVELKILARGRAASVVEELWRAYKVDARLVKRIEAHEVGRGGPVAADLVEEEEEEEEWGGGFADYPSLEE
ncbi:hypothetical protein MMC11_005020 [Xylographa trunciseda]|nr:hypothetical protein [Xylographa trunciseda]